MIRIGNKRAQVWVETVIYTLIGLAVIGLVLAGAMPKINQKKDEIAIDQSIESLSLINDKIYEVQRGTGNRRSVSLEVKSGSFIIDTNRDEIYWVLESSFPYSEVGYTVSIGKINVTTTGEEKPWAIELKTSYSMDIVFDGQTVGGVKQFDAASIPYTLTIENDGKNDDGNIKITFDEV